MKKFILVPIAIAFIGCETDPPIDLVLTISTDGNGSATPLGPTTVSSGIATTITAYPDDGYLFDHWETWEVLWISKMKTSRAQ